MTSTVPQKTQQAMPVTEEMFQLSDLQEGTKSIEIGNRLQLNGYLKLHLNDSSILSREEKYCLDQWETVYRNAFQMSEEFKTTHWSPFDTVKGYTVGYRIDGKREFLETRLSGTSSQGIDPEIKLDSVDTQIQYIHVVKTCVQLYHKIGQLILACVAETLGVEEKYFLDLIDNIAVDRNNNVTYSTTTNTTARSSMSSNESVNSDYNKELKISVNDIKIDVARDVSDESSLISDMLSSSLLRICNYPLAVPTKKRRNIVQQQDNEENEKVMEEEIKEREHERASDKDEDEESDIQDNIAFGAHTDVSLLTLGLCSSYPGLEIRDLLTHDWVRVEQEIKDSFECKPEPQNTVEGEIEKVCDDECATDMTVMPEPEGMANEEVIKRAETRLTENTGPGANAEGFCRVMVVFVGDILQLLSRSVYKATPHRVVVRPPRPSHPNTATTTISSYSSVALSRVSCPFILRGRHPSIIPPIASYARFPASLLPLPAIVSTVSDTPSGIYSTSTNTPPEPDFPELPDLEGSSMKLLHKLLDLKRQKCLRENSDNSDVDWVLAAYSTH